VITGVDETTVTVEQGTLRGIADGGLLRWRGIPYAEPPVGALRWRAPQPPRRWSGVREAAVFGNRAPQSPGVLPSADLSPTSEDCLYLNVCAPAGAAGLPVLVWIHGGGFRDGSGVLMGEGDAFARAGIVVVTINYRLGALGFSHLEAVFGDGSFADAGVAGLLDQVAALRWVRANIAELGGDPARVTVYGESAGGKSVGALMGSPRARGLFARAIVSSGGADHVATPETGGELARRLHRELGEPDAAAARALPAEQVLAAQERIRAGVEGLWVWRPTLHPDVLPQLPVEAVAAGSASGVELLIGHNGDEARLFQALLGPAATAPADDVLAGILGPDGAAALLDTYATGRGISADAARVAAMSDERYGIPTQRLADAQAGHSPVHRYRFDAASPGHPRVLDGAHGSELPAVWQVPVALPGVRPKPNPVRERVAAQLHAIWLAFVRDGTCDWPAYDTADRAVLVVGDETAVELDPRAAERRAWGDATWQSGTWWPLAP
jgi:para-nitrobenzyl esterase